MPPPHLLAKYEHQDLNLCAQVLSSYEQVAGTPKMGNLGKEINSLDWLQARGRWSLSFLLETALRSKGNSRTQLTWERKRAMVESPVLEDHT